MFESKLASWNPEDVTDVCITMRTLLAGPSLPARHHYYGIKGMQFREQYVAVIVGDGRAFIYPYVLVETIETLNGAAVSSRDQAIDQFRAMTKGDSNVQTDVPESAGTPEPGNDGDGNPCRAP